MIIIIISLHFREFIAQSLIRERNVEVQLNNDLTEKDI